ncbi:MAG TPA: putative baseplate assembly protein [Actinomycetes bacterium]|nr:putative baseplate assembly protein [Actinomycetes bacterium]
MTLIGPNLDDRSFEQLKAELLERIPVFNREWTNHNESDPGVALLELFAFLGESLLYRFNQIPDATKTAFLRLLDVQRLPARPAHVLVIAKTERPEGEQLLAHSELRAGPVSFETDNELYAWPLEVLGAVKVAVASPADDDELEARRRCDALLRMQVAAGTTVQFYETVLVPADPLATGATPVDVAATVDRALWIALLRRDTTDPRLLAGRGVFLGVALDETVDRPFTLDVLDAAAADRYRSTGLDEDPPAALWRLWKGPVPATDTEGPFRAFTPAYDTTRGFTQSGVVHLTLPDLSIAGSPADADGGLDSPPPLDDPDQAARVLAWLQVSRPQPATGAADDPIHRVRWVGVNAVEATQARTARPELLGTGNGDADQRFPLTQANVLPGTMELQVEEAETWRTWTEVEDFVGTKTGDRHYRIDQAAGEVRFPPGGERGRVPQIGERVRVRFYRYGGGSAGNVREGTVKALNGLDLTNPLPAQDGRDAEALGDALDRIPAEVHRRERAVTADDFRDLALGVAGVRRADTLALLHPDNPTVPAAGIVSVVVFPGEDTRNPGAPLPDHALLRRVARHLDQRRLITTELYVIPPEYRAVSVAAGVVVRDGYQVDAVRRWVELILRQFLAPLPPYGPDGGGWPLGRTIRRAELEAVAVQVEGVEFLDGLRLAVPDGAGGWTEVPTVALERWQVPELTEITVVEGEPLAPGASYQPAPPATRPGTVLVPLPREVC